MKSVLDRLSIEHLSQVASYRGAHLSRIDWIWNKQAIMDKGFPNELKLDGSDDDKEWWFLKQDSTPAKNYCPIIALLYSSKVFERIM